MSLLKNYEQLIENFIDKMLLKKFNGPIQPQEISKKIIKEMYRNKRTSINNIYVPNIYIIYLSKEDFDEYETIYNSFVKELTAKIEKKAAEAEFTLAGNLTFELTSKDGLTQGEIEIECDFEENEESVQEDIGEKTYQSKEASEVNAANTNLSNTLTFDKRDLFRVAKQTHHLLKVTKGPDQGKVFYLNDVNIIIGRAPQCNIRLNDANVSREHAQIQKVNNLYFITDLNSTNNTYLNETKINRKELNIGDKILVGRTELVFQQTDLT